MIGALTYSEAIQLLVFFLCVIAIFVLVGIAAYYAGDTAARRRVRRKRRK